MSMIIYTFFKEIFTKASEQIFTASNQYVYFGKIKVVIPKSWSTQPNYIQVPALSSLDTFIDVNNENITTPYVKTTGYCGEEGLKMSLHTSFLLKTGRTFYGNHGESFFLCLLLLF